MCFLFPFGVFSSMKRESCTKEVVPETGTWVGGVPNNVSGCMCRDVSAAGAVGSGRIIVQNVQCSLLTVIHSCRV